MDDVKLYQGDCLELMKDITSESIDMILCDLPYGTTRNRWDVVIPFADLWEQYCRIIKRNGAILLFSDGLFTSHLVLSNAKMWRYNLVWDKVLSSGFLNANKMPLRRHELISVFYKKPPTYNPQKTVGKQNHGKGSKKDCENNNYGNYGFADNRDVLGNLKHPTSILTFPKPHPSISVHPTQKPVELLEYLVKTYTNYGDIVLDNCMGCGSTGIACVNTGRRFIGMELDEQYFDTASNRIEDAKKKVAV